MTEETMAALFTALPNFAGFSLLGLLMYRALMESLKNNRELAQQMIECYRERNNTRE
jgi:hypothetical protein